MSGIRLWSGVGCLLCAVLILAGAEAQTQPYPERPLRFIVPATPAGPNDTLARVISAPRRTPLFPELPTFEESGLPDFEVSTWFGILTRAGVSVAIVRRLNEEINRILLLEDVRARLEILDAEPAGGSISEFEAHIRSERVKWAKVIKETGIVID